jgi:hypothetical protein
VNDIKQLLYTYPRDMKMKDGQPFWSLPKRAPNELSFDPENSLHASFINAVANMKAKIFGIQVPSMTDPAEEKRKLAAQAMRIPVKEFNPSKEKARAIASEVEKELQGDGDKDKDKEKENGNNTGKDESEDTEAMTKEIVRLLKVSGLPESKWVKVAAFEEFDKDNDSHVDVVYSFANCRAANYALEPMEWIQVKLKAGRIIPALATTTAAIAGLQTIELVKVLKRCKVEWMRNTFLNLAIPLINMSEPAPPPSTKLREGLSVTIWDRWDVYHENGVLTRLVDVFEFLKAKYGLEARNVFRASKPIYMHWVMNMPARKNEKEEVLQRPLVDLLDAWVSL